MKLSIIIPAYNEERTLEILVSKVFSVRFPQNTELEVIIINDCSTDKTPQVISKLQRKFRSLRTLSNEKNVGKSRTVRHGILNSTGDYVVIQDADLEYDPDELVKLYTLALEKKYDIVYGNRFGKKNKVIYWKNYIGNKGLSIISNIFTFPRIKIWIPDMEVCYKMIRGDVARELAEGLTAESNFGFEPEITAKLSKYSLNGKRLSFGIIPISYNPRSIAEGKHMKAVSDGIKALKEILHYNTNRYV